MAGRISMGARREVVSAVAERYRSAKRAEKGRILDALCATTGWHRKSCGTRPPATQDGWVGRGRGHDRMLSRPELLGAFLAQPADGGGGRPVAGQRAPGLT